MLVRKINLYENANFLLGGSSEKQKSEQNVELPELIAVDGIEYAQVNFEKDEISYLKTEAFDEPVYTLIQRTVKITNGVYLYVYPFNTQIFENEEKAQAAADELNFKGQYNVE